MKIARNCLHGIYKINIFSHKIEDEIMNCKVLHIQLHFYNENA